MRSRDAVSSSSAARLTAPSAAISSASRVISACSALPFSCGVSLASSAASSAFASASCCGELFGGQARRLFLQLQFGELVAARLDLALERHPLLVGRPQLLGQFVHAAARLAQASSARRTLRQPRVETGAGGAVVQPGQSGGGACDVDLEALGLVGGRLGGVLDVALPLAVRCQREFQLLARRLERALVVARAAQRLVACS